MSDIIPQKQCSRCQQPYPHTAEYFHRDCASKSGLKGYCKKCGVQSASNYYDTHREDVLKQKKEHRLANPEIYAEREHLRYQNHPEREKARWADYRQRNPEKRKIAMASWRSRNPQKIKDYSRKYHQDHLEACRQKARDYYRAHLEEKLAYAKSYNAKRRAIEKAQGDGYSLADVRLQYHSQRGKCWHCSKKLDKRFHVDHLIPLKKGGKHDASNIVISCPLCNLSKKDKLCYRWNGRLF